MDFEAFLPLGEKEDDEPVVKPDQKKMGSHQVYDIITGKQADWQALIYDLIHSEQLDPLDIDIVILTKRYFEKIGEMDELDFYISSKVLLAASLLLRIKSDFILQHSLKSIDDILFGKKEVAPVTLERIEIDEDALPLLIPRTPLPRSRKVTLPELISALNKAMDTEARRIKREVSVKRAQKLSEMVMPIVNRVDLKDRIRQFYARVMTAIKRKSVSSQKHHNTLRYIDLIGSEREERLASFLPLLHLSNSQKVWVHQDKHLEDIWIYLYSYFDTHREAFIEELEQDIEEMKEELVQKETMEEVVSGLDKAHAQRAQKKQLSDAIAAEIADEFGLKE
jgi:segregation and condensation protein A